MPSFAGKHVGAWYIGAIVKDLHILSGGWITSTVPRGRRAQVMHGALGELTLS